MERIHSIAIVLIFGSVSALILALMFIFGVAFNWGFLILAAIGGIGVIFSKLKGG